MKKNKAAPEQWTSKFGFIMAASGSAIGLGNLWKFPYVAGRNGGALFLIIYVAFLLLLGFPILLSELAVGRYAGMNAVASCRKIDRKWGFVGGLGIFGAFTVLSGYCVVGGWVLKYFASSLSGGSISPDFFPEYSARAIEPIVWTFVFTVITAIIVIGGVSGGIEKVSSVLLPVLTVFLIGIMVYSLTLPNASEGVKFFLVPDPGEIGSWKDIARIALSAMGQVFFSLSLGMGTLITYGSYLPGNSGLVSNTLTIIIFDTLIAVIAGFAILPAVFSLGLEPTGGPGLLFSTLPVVFARLPGGGFMGGIFFLLVFFAAVTSAISLLEVIVAWLSAAANLSRRTAAIISSAVIFGISCLASLSFGALSGFRIGGMSFFELLEFLSDKLIMPLGGIFICILVGYKWGIKPASREITNQGRLKFRLGKLFEISVKYLSPLLIALIFVFSLIGAFE